MFCYLCYVMFMWLKYIYVVWFWVGDLFVCFYGKCLYVHFFVCVVCLIRANVF